MEIKISIPYKDSWWILEWRKLSRFGSMKIMRLTVLLVFFPLLFDILNNIHNLSITYPFIGMLTDLEWPSWKFWSLTIFYYGLIFLTIGFSIYQIFCPTDIRIYPNYTDFYA